MLSFSNVGSPEYLEHIKYALNSWNIKYYSWMEKNGKLGINVRQSINWSKKNLKKIPFDIIWRVEGDVDISENCLTTLKNCPMEILGNFKCGNNFLTSLKWGPKKVQGDYHCNNNQLKSLIGVPQFISGNFLCNFNQLKNLKYVPQEIGSGGWGNFDCSDNCIETLLYLPEKVAGFIDFDRNEGLGKFQVCVDFDELKTEHLRIKELYFLKNNLDTTLNEKNTRQKVKL